MKLDFKSCNKTDNNKAIEYYPTEIQASGKEYILFGENNNMPNIYYNAFSDCSILQSIINTVSDYVFGNSFENDLVINRKAEKLSCIVKKCILDYMIFGSFALNVIRNKKGEIAELNYIDVRFLRLNANTTNCYVASNWGKYTKNIKKYEVFNPYLTQPNSIFYYKNPKSRGVYGLPIWSSTLREVLTLIEASKLNYNSVSNQFTPTTLISFTNGTPSEDVQDKIESLIHEKFTGSNGNNILLSWCEDREHAPELNTFNAPDYTERYTKVIESCKSNILVAFRCSSQLVGLLEGQTAFNDIEFTNAFTLFKSTVIIPIQQEIEQAFSTVGFDFTLSEFKVNFVDNGKQVIV